ncbi:methyltransferase domain-containing protein [Sarocladium implicatum]|nr:methyltransferase domain-containing protein [Sarocladium implicatum]
MSPTETLAAVVETDRTLLRTIKAYYESWESYFGYHVALGGAQHYGYYDKGTFSPFPIPASLERMQDQVPKLLKLPAGSKVLDVGCGLGAVAVRVVKQARLRVTGLDVLDLHVDGARQRAAAAGLSEDQLAVRKLDYHHLEGLATSSFDGAYTVQSLAHATDPAAVLSGLHRVIRPGGRIVLLEAEGRRRNIPRDDHLGKKLSQFNEMVGYTTNEVTREDFFKDLATQAGFVDVQVHDYTENIWPMLRFCYLFMLLPFVFVRLLGLEKHFITMFATHYGWVGRDRWRFIAVSAKKPEKK